MQGHPQRASAPTSFSCITPWLTVRRTPHAAQIDVQVDNHHLADHIEWDLRSPLTPEAFTHQLCLDLGLSGEAGPLIAHAIHEELVKHKRDAIEWGLIGGAERERDAANAANNAANAANATTAGGAGEDAAPRDKSGLSLMKDKTGLGLGWGRTPKDGRGPRVLRSVWRDWPEAEEFGTRWEALSVEEVERREVERERASRCVALRFRSSATRLFFVSPRLRLTFHCFFFVQAAAARDVEVSELGEDEAAVTVTVTGTGTRRGSRACCMTYHYILSRPPWTRSTRYAYWLLLIHKEKEKRRQPRSIND